MENFATLLVAIMAGLYSDGSQDVFIFQDPIFQNQRECVDFVSTNNYVIYDKLTSEYPNQKLDKLLCVDADKLEILLKDGYIPPKGNNI